MLTDLKVKVGPQFYRYHEGALASVPSLFKEYHAQRILVVHGTVSLKKLSHFALLGRFRVSILLSHLHRRM